jgi:hypothetical protein
VVMPPVRSGGHLARFELFFSCIIFFCSFFSLFTMGSTYNLSCESAFQISDKYMGWHVN